jgi:alkaline phosphatase D
VDGVSRRAVLAGGAAMASLAALAPLAGHAKSEPPLTRIAFGSCAKQDKEQPIWDMVNAYAPELFIFLGDNIYGDTEDMAVLRAKYAQLAAKPGFQKLKASSRVIATWDDHDYGVNDGGAEYRKKQESKDMFLDFWNEPIDSPRRMREGIYTSYLFGPPDRRVQVILLDLRWWRTPLLGYNVLPEDRGPYIPNPDPAAVFMGEAQWAWFENELKQPAAIRLIGTSTQFLADNPGWEAWVQFPYEFRRMLAVLTRSRANGVLFLSGDTHYTELSRLEGQSPYPLYDMTSSGLTETWPYVAPNRNRIGEGFSQPNFGVVQIDWTPSDPRILLSSRSLDGGTLISREIKLSELQARG